MDWKNPGDIGAIVYHCGFCGEKVSSSKGYYSKGSVRMIYICPNCTCPTYIDKIGEMLKQYPGVAYGNKVEYVPENINALYEEARNCMSIQAYTTSVMASRKLLMNIAVEKGADEGLSFMNYVEYLDSKHYIPPDGKEWVDHIRQKGNEANHEIIIMEKEDAEELINFIEMLLKIIYEFPGKMKQKKESSQTNHS